MESNFADDQRQIAGLLRALLDGTQPPISLLEAKQMCFRGGGASLRRAVSLQIGALTHAVLSEAFSALGGEPGNSACIEQGASSSGQSSLSALERILTACQRCEDFTRKATAILGPTDHCVRFRDSLMGSFDRAFRRSLYRSLHANSEGLARCLGEALLVGGRDPVAAFLTRLRSLGLARGLLLRLRSVLASQDYAVTSARSSDFSFVCEYLSLQRSVYPRGFYTPIERGVLQRLYREYDAPSLVRVLCSLRGLRSVYACFSKAGLLDTLVGAHRSILLGSSAGDIHEMLRCREVDCAVRHCFRDPRFRELSDAFYAGVSEDPRAVAAVVGYVCARNSGTEKTRDEIDAFVVFIVECSRSPGALLDSLRVALGNRLLLATADIGLERSFLMLLRRSYAEKMLCMIDDAEKRRDGAPLLMRMCMWPCYESAPAEVREDGAVGAEKARVASDLGALGKRVQWLDTLARARVSVGGVLFVMTLFQYSLLVRIAEGGVLRSAVVCLGAQGERLLCSGLVSERDGRLHLCPAGTRHAEPVSLLPERFALQNTEHSEGGAAAQGSSHAVIQAQIARAMKARKTLPLSELCALVPGAGEHIAALVDKGLLEVSGETVAYII